MKFKKNFFIFLLIAIFLIDPLCCALADEPRDILLPKSLPPVKMKSNDQESVPFREGKILVQFKRENLDPRTRSGRLKKYNLENQNNVSQMEKINDSAFLYEIKDNSSVKDKIDELKNNSAVEIVQPDYVYKSATITPPNDTNWPIMWGLSNTGQSVNSTSGTSGDDIKWLYAWDKYINDPDNEIYPIIVANIDTGFDYNHPDVSVSNLWDGSTCKNENGNYLGGCQYGYDYDYGKKDPMDASMDTHGTITGGAIAATINNGVGIPGLAPDVKLMSIKADFQSGGYPGEFDTATITKAVKFATQNGAKIIDMNFGGNVPGDQLMTNAISAFTGLVIVAAGNDGADNDITPMYPCNLNATLANVICVGATDQNDALASFSNYGQSSVDIAAPGNNIVSLFYDPDDIYHYAYASGTSIAAPYVCGEASMIWEYKHTLTTAQVKNIILNTGDVRPGLSNIRQVNNGTDTGGRRINVYNALLSIDSLTATLSGTPASVTIDKTLNVNVVGTGITSYEYKLDSGSYSAALPISTPIAASGLNFGPHMLKVTGIDSLGHSQSQASATSFSWTVADSNSPAMPTGLTVN